MRPSLDAAAVAEMIGTSRDHVRKLARSRRIPFFKIGGVLRFDPDDLEGWLASLHVPCTRESQGLPRKIEDPGAIARVAELISNGDASGGDGT
jgi:excisionase family DNA binding protein